MGSCVEISTLFAKQRISDRNFGYAKGRSRSRQQAITYVNCGGEEKRSRYHTKFCFDCTVNLCLSPPAHQATRPVTAGTTKGMGQHSRGEFEVNQDIRPLKTHQPHRCQPTSFRRMKSMQSRFGRAMTIEEKKMNYTTMLYTFTSCTIPLNMIPLASSSPRAMTACFAQGGYRLLLLMKLAHMKLCMTGGIGRTGMG